ncbi:Cof-type HAD-IIB family hydrolase [Salipaludibacillus sp. HK11]|uniref:Cof-type HAD-IIB family hydrolase n=1 Tax=Salipaludibacillus sp. HK11 TaxID=3394320 RepID=UPI0039FC982D
MVTSTTTSKQVKLIALDMDGTLLNDKLEVTKTNLEAITKAQEIGVDVVLCTGRSLIACVDYAKQLKLTSYIITGNGSEIWHTSGELIERNILKSELVDMMWNLKEKHQTNHWAASVDKVWRNEMPKELLTYEWLKFGFETKDDKVREMLFDLLSQNQELEVSNSSLTNIEINAAGVNKAVALNTICKNLNCEMGNVLTIGDSLNDIAMIREAGFGVAMGNAQPTVKKAANWVTSTNNEDGVAHAIDRFVFKK